MTSIWLGHWWMRFAYPPYAQNACRVDKARGTFVADALGAGRAASTNARKPGWWMRCAYPP
jgi:hypothetical protein